MRCRRQAQRGFTLLELLVATAIFMVVCAAMFGLLQVSQEKYAIEMQMSGSFGEARLSLDQIVRDINVSGYPAKNLFSNPASSTSYAQAAVAWDPNYLSVNGSCQIGVDCTTPTDTDLILETDLGDGNGVSWIRYQLQGSVLYRGVIPKTGGDPLSAAWTDAKMTPLVNNVVYNPTGWLADLIAEQYPAMFPGGVQPPLFAYTCSAPSGPQACTSAPAGYNGPKNISDVDITLIVRTPQLDLQTGRLGLIELTGRGHRGNSGN